MHGKNRGGPTAARFCAPGRVRRADPSLRVVELYAGTARSWEPFREWKRASLALLVDCSRHAFEVYLANFPSSPYLCADLATCPPGSLLRYAGGRANVVLGCPPCQGFSDAGLRRAADPRNKHLLRFGVVAVAMQPSVIAMENVPGVAASRDFGAFTKFLEESSYTWTAGIYNAAAWGSAQSRQRLLLIAAKKDLGRAPSLPSQATHGKAGSFFNYSTRQTSRLEEDVVAMLGVTPATARLRGTLPVSEEILGPGAPPTVGEKLDGLPSLGTAEAKTLTHIGWRHGREMLQRMAEVEEGGQWAGGKDHYSHSYGRLHRRGLARTITRCFNNPGSGRYWHASENRALTVREAARLQGFPDEFRFPCHMTTAADLIGNALDASLSGIVYRSVRQLLE